jgi:predicted nucleic acid-binding protein
MAPVTILDANILLYATDTNAPQYQAISRWLKGLLATKEIVGLPG